MKTVAIALATVLTASLAGTAQATAVREVQQRVVSYSDLNLTNATDAAILRGRIESAARSVCLRRAGLSPLEFYQHTRRTCMDEAIARAVADVNAPLLAQHREIVVRNVE
jgi:UrcA family protein